LIVERDLRAPKVSSHAPHTATHTVFAMAGLEHCQNGKLARLKIVWQSHHANPEKKATRDEKQKQHR